MRITTVTATAILGALTTATLGLAGPAVAVPAGHRAAARADWKHGATVVSAVQNRYWGKARQQLGDSSGYAHERHDLAAIIAIPLTNTTAKERATEKRVIRELNGFFHTSGLYGIHPDHPVNIARADWIRSAHIVAARQSGWLAATRDELDAYGTHYRAERADLSSLQSIPLTGTTAKQRASARRDYRGLDKFFHTPDLHN